MSEQVKKIVTKDDITLTALTEVLKVDPKELKKAALIQALRESAAGNSVEIDNNFYKDILELVNDLTEENEKLENLNSQLLSRGDDLAKENKELRHKINKALNIASAPCVYQTYPNPHKKYRGEAVTCIIDNNLNVFHRRMNEIEDALEGRV